MNKKRDEIQSIYLKQRIIMLIFTLNQYPELHNISKKQPPPSLPQKNRRASFLMGGNEIKEEGQKLENIQHNSTWQLFSQGEQQARCSLAADCGSSDCISSQGWTPFFRWQPRCELHFKARSTTSSSLQKLNESIQSICKFDFRLLLFLGSL